MYMKDSAKKVKVDHRDLEKLEWEYDRPQREKIRRKRKRPDDETMERTNGKKGGKRQRNKDVSHS